MPTDTPRNFLHPQPHRRIETHGIDSMQSPADFAGEEVHIRGSVLNGSLDTGEHTFSMGGGTYNLTIDFAGTAVPPGFEEGRVVAIKGLFSNQGGEWKLHADEIITGCPSKYEAESS